MAVSLQWNKIEHCYVEGPGLKENYTPITCTICQKNVLGNALAEVETQDTKMKVLAVFHRLCIYMKEEGWKNTFPPFSLYYMFPDFCFEYQDTSENRERVAKSVAAIYTCFLTKTAHIEPLYSKFVSMGIGIDKLRKDDDSLDEEHLNRFSICLEKIVQHACQDYGTIDLQIRYGVPGNSPLRNALLRADIVYARCSNLFPRNSQVLVQKVPHFCNKAKIECIAEGKHTDKIRLSGSFSSYIFSNIDPVGEVPED